MKRLLFLLAFLACTSVSAFSQGAPPWTIQEVDGSPRVNSPTLIKVTNGTLSCSGKTCTITTGGGGSGCVPAGSAGQLLYDDGAGACSSASGLVTGGATLVQTSTSATAFESGPNGATNPVFRLVNNVASAATGISITGRAAAAGVDITVLSSGTDENLRLAAKGTGAVVFNDGAAATPAIRFASDTDDGWYRGASDGWIYTFGGAARFYLVNNDLRGSSSSQFGWTNGSVTGSFDTHLLRAAASTVRVGNGGSGAGNLIIGTSAGAIGTSGAGVLAFTLSTEPSTSPTDTAQIYGKDFAAGQHRAYLRNEADSAGSPIITADSTDTLTNKTLSTSNSVSAALSWADNIRQTFNPGVDAAGINVGAQTAEPGTPSNGDIFYDSDDNALKARINGAWVSLGAGGGGSPGGSDTQLQYNNAGSFGGITGATTNGTVVTLTSPVVNTGITLNAAPLTMSGNISSAAWTTSGLRIKGVPATLTDTTSSGTVAAAYTNAYGGNTIAASSSTTFTDYYTTFMTQPTAGSNVTFTNRWALGLSGAGALTNNLAANTSGDGWVLQNTSTASSGNQMYSPRLRLTGQGWKTNATAASQTVDWILENQPVQGAASPTTNLVISSQVNAGGYTSRLSLTSGGQAIGGDGTAALPAFAFSGGSTNGIYRGATNVFNIAAGGTGVFGVYSAGTVIPSTANYGISASSSVTAAADTIWRRAAAANWAAGADAASPVAQTTSVANVTAGTSNTAGANWTFTGSRGTGTGNGGQLIFQTAPAGGSGTSQNTLVTAFTIASDGVIYPKAYTHANLPTPVSGDGGMVYCSDCTIASPCASGGTGALAKRLNGAWVCN